MFQSDFQKVGYFNTQFGVDLKTSFRDAEFCLKLIREEVKELHEAMTERDYIEVIDALADILYVVYGMGCRVGINMDYYFDMFCDTLNTNFNMINKIKESQITYNINDKTPITEPTKFKKVLEYIIDFKKIDRPSFEVVNDENFKNALSLLQTINIMMEKLESSVVNKQYEDVVICLSGIAFTSYKMCAVLGTDMDEAFTIVHDNNMSKLCSTEEDAIATVSYYITNKNKLGYDSPAYRLAPDNTHWIVFNESTKKILKSIKWKEVDLTVMYNTQ